MSRGNQVYFKKGRAIVGDRDRRIACSELFEELGGEVIPLADTEVKCQRQKDVYSFVKNNKDLSIDPTRQEIIIKMII